MSEICKWPRIPHLFREMTVVEKIDGITACIDIQPLSKFDDRTIPHWAQALYVLTPTQQYGVWVHTRRQWVTPLNDCHGIARWVGRHVLSLVNVLGPGHHHGVWWGHGINRGYGLPPGDRRFSLYNVSRWQHLAEQTPIPGLGVLPVLGRYPGFNPDAAWSLYDMLMESGSEAVPGWPTPAGVLVYHHAADVIFQITDTKPMPDTLRYW